MIAVYLRQLQLLVHSHGDTQIERLVLQPVSSEEARVRGRLRYYPDLPGFPEHKHEDDRGIPAPAPDLGDVLREIDGYLYP